MPRKAVHLEGTIENALPLLLRSRVIDSVLEVQNRDGAPVTAQQTREGRKPPLLRSPRALSDLAFQIVELGPDEQGRALHAVGKDRKGHYLWWVTEPAPKPVKKAAPRKKAARKKARAR